jgi:predicted amidophosphoribosyltransferase
MPSLSPAARLVDPLLAVVFPARCPACARLLRSPRQGPLCEACWAALPRHDGRL